MKRGKSGRSFEKPGRNGRDKGERSGGGGGFVDRSGNRHGVRRTGDNERSRGPDSGGVRNARGDRGGSHRGEQRRDERKSAPGGGKRLKGTIDKHRRGFAFLKFDRDGHEDLFIPPNQAERLVHGDRVEVTVSRGEIIGIKVVEHRFRDLIGRFTPNLNSGGIALFTSGFIVYERKNTREEIHVPKLPAGMTVRPGDWVKGKLTFHDGGQHSVTAEITAVLGQELPASADVAWLAAEYNLIEEHPADAEREAREYKWEIPKGRKDLRDVPFITIDGETARDFDDAVYVEREGSNFVLWVAIADVSYYVREGTALDASAKARGTSVYFPERAFHMLPRALSENLCSLRPNEPRLALVAKIHLNGAGHVKHTDLYEAVIESRRRATYTEIQAEWEKYGKAASWEYRAHFELYRLLRENRARRGSIDFDLAEAEVVVDAQGEPVSIKRRGRLDAHRLIEEFMIAANEAATSWMLARKRPFIYRIHEEPNPEAIGKFAELAASVGVRMAGGPDRPEGAKKGPKSRGRSQKHGPENFQPIGQKALAEFIRRLADHPAAELLNTALLRSMKQAKYSASHAIHYGLASKGYTHFTSPIRRYPDLIVHRLIRETLQNKGRPNTPDVEEALQSICDHCNYRERLAAEADREAIRLKQVRAIRKHLGDEFDGKINGMMEKGLFIELDDPFCEGLLHRDALADDFYHFDEDRLVFIGSRKRRVFRIGDRVKVSVIAADVDRRQIDFGLAPNPAPNAKSHAKPPARE